MVLVALPVPGHTETQKYVQLPATCVQSHTSCQLPTGLLEPLSVPRRPWYHMAVDFVTDLPDLEDPGGDRSILQSLLAGVTERPGHSNGNCHSAIQLGFSHLWAP